MAGIRSLVLLLVFTARDTLGELTVEWGEDEWSSKVYVQGETQEPQENITCIGKGFQEPILAILQLEKKLKPNDENPESFVPVVIKTVLDGRWDKSRYGSPSQDFPEFEEEEENGRTTFRVTLRIKKLEGNDGGFFRCTAYETADDKHHTSEKRLSVKADVTAVYFEQQLANGDPVRVPETQNNIYIEEGDRNAVCVAEVERGTYPPIVKLTVDGNDVSHLFSPTIAYYSADAGPDHPLEMKTVAKMEFNVIESNSSIGEIHGKHVTCTAYKESEPATAKTARKMFDMKYSPRLDCTRVKYYTHVKKELTIKCNVTWSPPGSFENGDLQLKIRNDPAFKIPGTAKEGYSFNVESQQAKEHVHDITITILETTSEQFGDYELQAENQFSNNNPTRYRFTVIEGDDPSAVGGCSCLIPYIKWMIFFLCVIYIGH